MKDRNLARLRTRLGKTLRPWLIHRQIQWALDAICCASAVFSAYLLRFDFSVPQPFRSAMVVWALLLCVAYPTVLGITQGYRSTWQFFGLRDFSGLVLRVTPIALSLAVIRAFLADKAGVPYSVVFIWYGVVLAISSGLRVARRIDHEALIRITEEPLRTLIVGTESTMAGAIRQIQTFGGATVIGLVSEDLQGMKVAGVRVLGPLVDLHRLILKHRIGMIFLSSVDIPGISDVTKLCSDYNIVLKFLPSALDVTTNRICVSKNVRAMALRGALDEKTNLHPAIVATLAGRTILVTGAGGSIGSELVRQIASTSYERLLLLDQDENSIFELLNELGRKNTILPIIADIRDRDAIRNIFRTERPDIVLHAAAYKHVPMMEDNPCEAVLNNICGTDEVARAARDFASERFVMISTDKAVRPSSVMGATKRVAEMLVQQLADVDAFTPRGKTQFACVRFGNVLGSRGSVLPIFLKQIAEGGPITITHAEMTRYFMTIPQAVNLVLQAATLSSYGDVYMLDMGDPVRIIDFARQLLEHAGVVPNKDVRIEVVGARPGEKLHEQLWNDDAHVTPTDFPQVHRIHATHIDPRFSTQLDGLIAAARQRRVHDVRQKLREMPMEFHGEQVTVTDDALSLS